MQFLKDLPQTTQLSIALVLVLLPVLAAIVLSKKKTAAATPADAASRKERRRRGARTAETKTPRRKRRNLADETAQQLGAPVDGDSDVDLIINPDDIAAPEGVTVVSDIASPPAPPRDVHAALVTTDVAAAEADSPADEREPADVAVAVIDDPYVTVAPAVAVGASVAQPGWPSPGELASGFDPDAFDPLPPAAPHVHHDEDGDTDIDAAPLDIDSGDAWLDENLTTARGTTAPDIDTDSADTQVIQVTAVEWNEDDDFDPATGWSDDESDVALHVAIDGEEQPEWVVPAPAAIDDDDEISDDDSTLEAPSADESDDERSVAASEDDELTDWDEDDEPLTSVAWDAPDSDEHFDDSSATADEPHVSATEAWQDDDEDADDTWTDGAWGDDDPRERAVSTPLAVPYPPPGTLPAHEQVATLAVPFPAPGTLPAHEETVRVFDESHRHVASEVAFGSAAPQMPAITGRIDTGSTVTPVVIDLASLVAHGERVEMVIEQDPSGTGVRLRFGPGVADPEVSAVPVEVAVREPIDEPAAPVDAHSETEEPTTDAGSAALIAAQPAPSPYEQNHVDIPFLTGGPRMAPPHDVLDVIDVIETSPAAVPLEAPEPRADEPHIFEPTMILPADDAPHRPYDAAPEPIAPATIGVESTTDDDPGKILADIRARLAALDQRRTTDENTV